MSRQTIRFAFETIAHAGDDWTVPLKWAGDEESGEEVRFRVRTAAERNIVKYLRSARWTTKNW